MSAQQKQTVLVVDDDPEIRKMLALALDRMGFTVSQAADGRTDRKSVV